MVRVTLVALKSRAYSDSTKSVPDFAASSKNMYAIFSLTGWKLRYVIFSWVRTWSNYTMTVDLNLNPVIRCVGWIWQVGFGSPRFGSLINHGVMH